MQEVAKKQKDSIRRLILIVDDEKVNRRLLGKIIEEEFDVIYADEFRFQFRDYLASLYADA